MTQLQVSTLADRAVLVKFTKRVFTPYKRDKQATKTVEDTYGVKAGSYNKKILSESLHFAQACDAAQAAYWHYFNNTSPWLDEEGQRVLGNEHILEFTQAMSPLIDEANRAFDNLEINWDQTVATDILRLGSLGRPEDYPDHIRDRFEVKYILRPMPTDFRTEVPESELLKLQDSLAEAEKVVQQDTVRRLMEPIIYAAKGLAEYTQKEAQGKRTRFVDSIILNIGEQSKMARKLNLAHDPALDAMCDEIDKLMAPHILAPDQVKDDLAVRQAAQKKLDDIMSKMSGWM